MNTVDVLSSYRDKFICGDALDVMRQMPNACLDLVVTSPPYNLKNSTGNGLTYIQKSNNLPPQLLKPCRI